MQRKTLNNLSSNVKRTHSFSLPRCCNFSMQFTYHSYEPSVNVTPFVKGRRVNFWIFMDERRKTLLVLKMLPTDLISNRKTLQVYWLTTRQAVRVRVVAKMSKQTV